MGRIRTIKPEFWVSEQIGNLCRDARLLFIGLWSFCDDRGVHPAKPRTLKAEVFPMDDVTVDDIDRWIRELVDAELITEFQANGSSYWHVIKWAKHQRIDRPTNRHPAPPSEDSTISRRALAESSPTSPHGISETPPSPRLPLGPGLEGNGKGGEWEVEPSASSAVPAADPPGFTDFWDAWPATARKVDRKKCAAKWKAAKLVPHLTVILAHVEAMKLTRMWIEGYEPAPLKYLNGDRWRDGPPPEPDDTAMPAGSPRQRSPLHADHQFS